MENTGTAAGIGREDAGFYPGTEDSAAEIGREDVGRTDEGLELGVKPEAGLSNGTAGLVSLDELAAQMRIYSDGARGDYQHMMMNLLQFGRVMMEAKGRVGHGRWQSWVEENSGFSLRTAESYMQAYQKFGLNPDVAKLGKSKALQMLPVPEDVREKVLAEHDVEHMSVREFKKLLKDETEKAAAEARAKAWAEAGERMNAERENIREQAKNEAREAMEEDQAQMAADMNRAVREAQSQMDREKDHLRAEMEKKFSGEREALTREIETARNSVPDELKAALEDKDRKIQEQKEEIQRLAAQAKETMDALKSGTGDLQSENGRLTRELRDAEEGLKDLQEQYERVQNEYLNLQSTIQKGDAERAPADELTPEVFSGAVRSFIGTVARMPQMAGIFSRMDADGRETFDTLLKTVEEWARGARRALDTFGAEGGVLA